MVPAVLVCRSWMSLMVTLIMTQEMVALIGQGTCKARSLCSHHITKTMEAIALANTTDANNKHLKDVRAEIFYATESATESAAVR